MSIYKECDIRGIYEKEFDASTAYDIGRAVGTMMQGKSLAVGCKSVCMEELLRDSDVVSLHGRIPLGSPPIITCKELSMMKPTAYLVNTARAMLVDMIALYEALKNKVIMGAAIDVFPIEPLPKTYPLLELDNITITNHRGGDTFNSYVKSPELLIKQFKELLETGNTKFMVR